MGGKKLTDSEIELRKRNRTKKLFASYKTNKSGTRGSVEQWKKAAELMLMSLQDSSKDLSNLDISKTPDTIEDLTKAWKKAMMKCHPDKGGVNEKAVLVNESYDRLKVKFSKTLKALAGKNTEDQGTDITPAKAEHINHIDYNNLWVDPFYMNDNFIAEKKLDGSRYILYLGEVCRLISRRISTVTGKYVDKTLNCPHLTRVLIPKEFWGTVIDGEMVHPKSEKSDDTTSIMGCSPEEAVARQKANGWLKFCVYDIPKLSGEDLRSLPLRDRNKKLMILIAKLSKYIPVVAHPHVPYHKAKELYESVVASGGEGIMMKDLNAPYGSGWYKVKKVVTFDVIILGYEAPKKTSKKSDGSISATHYHKEGLIGSVIFGAYKNGKLIELGTCSGMSEAIRRELSTNGQDNIGRVIEIKFQERTKSGSFRHCRFVKFREDKDATQCIDTEF